MLSNLLPDPNQQTEALLRIIALSINASAVALLPDPSPVQADPSRTTIWVQCLLYASIVCSLFAALGAVLGKQWLDHYMSVGERGTIETRGMERQRKFAALEAWHFRTILEFLPILLQASLFLFAIALCAFMWDIQRTVAKVLIITNGIGFLLYFVSVVASILFEDCPFQSSLSRIIQPFVVPCLDIVRYSYLGCLFMILVVVIAFCLLGFLGIALVRLCSSADPDVEDVRPLQDLERKIDLWSSTILDPIDHHLQDVVQSIEIRISDFLPSPRALTAALRHPRVFSSIPQDHVVGASVVWLIETSTDPIVLTDAIQVAPEVAWYPDFQVPTSVLDFLLPKVAESARSRQEGIVEPDADRMDSFYSAFLLFFWNHVTLDYKSIKSWARSSEPRHYLSILEAANPGASSNGLYSSHNETNTLPPSLSYATFLLATVSPQVFETTGGSRTIITFQIDVPPDQWMEFACARIVLLLTQHYRDQLIGGPHYPVLRYCSQFAPSETHRLVYLIALAGLGSYDLQGLEKHGEVQINNRLVSFYSF